MHQNSNVVNQFENYDTELIFIPRGMTRLLQPIDVSINKPLKDYLRKKYSYYCCKKNLTFAKIYKDTIIDWISDI